MTSTHPLQVSVQRAHHAHDESEALGLLCAVETMAAFDLIDWPQQAVEAQALQRVAPTFSVKQGPSLLWVSVAGEPPNIAFVASHSFPGEGTRLFGLLKSNGLVERHRHDLTPLEARQALEAFVRSDNVALRRLFDGA